MSQQLLGGIVVDTHIEPTVRILTKKPWIVTFNSSPDCLHYALALERDILLKLELTTEKSVFIKVVTTEKSLCASSEERKVPFRP